MSRTNRQRLGKKEKELRRALPTVEVTAVEESPQTYSFNKIHSTISSIPILFSQNSLYSFIPTNNLLKIYSSSSALLSTLTPPSLDSTAQSPITAILLNPSNPLQLIIATKDGLLSIWDYTEAKLLRTLSLGSEIQFITGHASLPDQLFVALVASAEELKLDTATENDDSVAKDVRAKAGVYLISLKPVALPPATPTSPSTPRTPSRRMRLAKPRSILALSVSPSGKHLISLNPYQINICSTDKLDKGFTQKISSEVKLTCLVFHPTENWFATGDGLGKIRLHYGALDEESNVKVVESTTSVLHWHAHAVSALSFTPNGAYLLSGGQEAVLVLWQLHTGHQEYVPRLGAMINSITVNDSVEAEQEIAVRLRDGSTVFVGAQKLKIARIIAGIRIDPAPASSYLVPLAIQPATASLVLPSSHPSSLQFYSPSTDTQTLELEVSPSNRVSAMGEKQVEPTRVEIVCFSQVEDGAVVGGSAGGSSGGGGYWMATLDTWIQEGFATERHIKFWRYRNAESGFVLSTRIDSPHLSTLTSMSFSPSSSSSSAPLLLTTSTDLSIKLWSYSPISASWRCHSNLSYRSFIPLDASWSLDGSMFAVVHKRLVTLWGTREGRVLQTFNVAAGGSGGGKDGGARARVAFGGKEGTDLVVGGKTGVVVWDLLTFQEKFSIPFVMKDLTIKPNSDIVIATESTPSSALSHIRPTKALKRSTKSSAVLGATFIIDTLKQTCLNRNLPQPIRQSTWFAPGSHAATKRGQGVEGEEEISLAVVDEQGEIALVKNVPGGKMDKRGEIKKNLASRLPSASTGQSRLFDQIFGVASTSTSSSAPPKALEKSSNVLKAGNLEVLDAPSHTLPPARLLWKSMLGSFAISSGEKEVKEVERKEDTVMVNGEVEKGRGEARAVVVENNSLLEEILRQKLSI